MRSGLLLVLTMLALVGGSNRSCAHNATVDFGNANTGKQTFHGPVAFGLTPDQVRQMMGDLYQKDSLNAQRAAELDREVERLSAEIGVLDLAVENFLRILGEAQIPVDQLGTKLQEIARHHRDLLEPWSVLEEDDDPSIRQRTDAARTAINAGDYDRADELFAEAEELDLAAARIAQEREAQARAVASRHFLAAAAKRAKRGDLCLARLDYPGAAEHFKEASELVPAEETLVLAEYLMREGSVLGYAGKYWEAEKSVKRALDLREKALGAEHPEVADTRSNLAALNESQGRYAEAELLYERSLFTSEAHLPFGLYTGYLGQGLYGEDHETAITINNLAALYTSQGRYAKAESLYQRSLTIKAKVLRPEDPSVATTLNNLAGLYLAQGRYAEAEPLYERSLVISEKTLGPDHPSVATVLSNLAGLYELQSRYTKAEPLYERSLAISVKVLGPKHPEVATTLNNLAGLYVAQDRYAEAGALYRRSLAIKETAYRVEHPEVATILNNLARLYVAQGRYAEAEPLYERSLAVKETAYGAEHPEMAITLNNLAGLYVAQGRYAEAEPLCLRSLAIKETALRPEHPSVAATLNNLAGLYVAQGRYAEAEPLYGRSLAISEKTLGPEHQNLVVTMSKYATILGKLGHDDAAAQWTAKAEAIRKQQERGE